MTVSKSASARSTTSSLSIRKSAKNTDEGVLALLSEDHRDVKKLFASYQKLAHSDAPASQRRVAAEQICVMLTVHATVEEELFYPAVRAAVDNASNELDEAEVEHASLKDLITQLQAMDPGDALYDAKVKVLGEYVNHHVQEEEGEMFPKIRKAGMDLDAIGAQVKARKEELMGSNVH